MATCEACSVRRSGRKYSVRFEDSCAHRTPPRVLHHCFATSTMLRIRPAVIGDTATLLELIRALADYEKLSHLVSASEASLREALFGASPAAEALLAFAGEQPVGFALYFHNFSTFLGRRGLWLEDIFVKPEH